ncbi:hypothetical protein HK405_008275 [Cladochytrium tenue]|nr:hypothetical protein HK405_008275 [Cladochytrium tenue]
MAERGGAAAAAAGDDDRRNMIFYDRIQAETIRKELRVHRLYDRYMLSPSVKSKLVITNTPQSMNLMNPVDDVEDEEYSRQATQARQLPRERNAEPVTSAQAYGWDAAPLVPPASRTDPRFHRPRVECDITRCYNSGAAAAAAAGDRRRAGGTADAKK